MKFGIFYEHQIPRPWNEGDEHKLFKDALDQIELADRLGFDNVWEVEHHFLEEYSHSSAPEVFLAAASQRTKQIRLGHGIVALPHQYNHPFRVAERIANLDLVSDGRVEFGTGETSSSAELDAFGVDRDTKREQWTEALDAITRMFVEEPFAGWDGKHIPSMPVRNVVPKTLQKPHPPLWVACSRRETIHLAAEKGIGALSFSFIEPAEAKSWVDDYFATIESAACVPAGFAVNPQIALTIPMLVHADEQTAIDRGLDGAHFFGYSLAHYYVFGTQRPAKTNIWEEFQKNRALFGFSRDVAAQTGGPLGATMMQRGLNSLRGAIGTPEQVRQLLRGYEEIGVDQMIFVMQAGANRHEHICESLELFAREVMPEFHQRDAARRKAKRERLGPAIERALARRAAARKAPEDYSFRAALKV
jgi:alkanesulfonate monooxygenase SsuD/methylene tetrahydromethanopterin reductase-like flavin-dependent oxidoreductase (luciferase family)